MPGLDNELVIAIPDNPHFFTLYADELYSRKAYIEESATYLYYPPDAVIALYYTYPSFRTASLGRH
jgi:hypothetical protein